MDQPEKNSTKITWEVSQHEGDRVVVSYQVLDVMYKVKLEGIRSDDSLELLKSRIENAVRADYKTHKLLGLIGEVEV